MGIGEVIYNKETGAIFTRTPASWGKIGLFYFVYYSCLAAFFAGLLSIFLFTFTDDKAPLLTGHHSVLPQNPGMGFRPRPDEDKTLIKFSKSNNATYNPYIDDLTAFLNPENVANTYRKGQSEKDYQECDDSGPQVNATYADKPCKFRVDDYKELMDECVNTNFGYEEGTPCIAIKLNKIYEFVPKLTEGDYLKFECKGEYAADQDNIGPVRYFPRDGVPLSFFPFVGQKGYLSPLVFVKLDQPQTGVLLQIVCMPTNAENIIQNKMYNGDGRVTLEVLIDE